MRNPIKNLPVLLLVIIWAVIAYPFSIADPSMEPSSVSDETSGGNLIWAKHAGGSCDDFGVGVTTLSDNSTVVTGSFMNSAIFGSGESNEVVLASAGDSDIFIAKYNPDGKLCWIKSAGGTGKDCGLGITSLSDNSTVVTGSFYTTATFGQDEPNETILTSAKYSEDIFIARYNPDGTLLWAKGAGGLDFTDFCTALTSLSDNSVVVTGAFWKKATFGPGELNETILTHEGQGNGFFIARYNPDGTLSWCKTAEGDICSNGITTLSDDSTAVTGFFYSPVTFGKDEPNQTNMTLPGCGDIFIARFNPDGTLLWAKQAGGSGTSHGYRITTLSDDSTVVTGMFMDSVTFGSGEPHETTLTPSGEIEIFIAKYDPDGILVWAKQSEGSEYIFSKGIKSLLDNSTVVTGSFSDMAIFGPNEPNETILTSKGKCDTFIARYNPDGTLSWVKSTGGPDNDWCNGITSLSDSSIVVTGHFKDTVTFGSGESKERVLNAEGGNDIFITRYNPEGMLSWVSCAGGSCDASGFEITSLSDDSTVVAGWFTGSAIFGSSDSRHITLTSAGESDIFIARYQTDGHLSWAKRAGGPYTEFIDGIVALSDNSTVITGGYTMSATFAQDESNETVFDTGEACNIFIARYNHDGKLAWAKRAGGSRWIATHGITTFSDNSTAIAGYFHGTATFGPGEENQTVITSGDHGNSSFIAMYNPDGTLSWVKKVEETNLGDLGITALSDDSIVVAGSFHDTATFGKGEYNETVLISVGCFDVFLALYNPDGTLSWVKQAGGAEDDNLSGITTLSDNSTVIIGEFRDSPTFGKGESNSTVLTFDGYCDIFIARYDSNGNLLWAKSAGGIDDDCVRGIATLSDDSTVVTGYFYDAVTFGSGETKETILTTDGENDIFVAKYNLDGELVWAKRAGGLDCDLSHGITALLDNSTVVTGSFQGVATFGSGESKERELTSAGNSDVLIARFAP